MTAPTPAEYTPTKQDIRQLWAEDQDSTFGEGYDVHAAEFDRWLAAHDAEVREKVAQAIEAVLPNADTFEARLGLNAAARIAREVTS